MFLKVFKYDFLAVIKKYVPMIIIVSILSVLTRLLNFLPADKVGGAIIIGGINGIFIISLMVLSIYTIVIVVQRYVCSLFRDQGYLTHTLPVNKHELLLSQILVAVIMTILTTCLILVCIFIAYFTPYWIDEINEILRYFGDLQLDAESIGTIILTLITGAAMSLQSILVLYFGISLGHAHCKNKTLLSVVYCIALSYGINIVTSIINLPIMNSITNVNAILSIYLVESLCVSVAGYFLTIFMMQKHLNLE